MPPRLEMILMRSLNLSYVEARNLVQDGRNELNMKYSDPWTDELRELCESIRGKRKEEKEIQQQQQHQKDPPPDTTQEQQPAGNENENVINNQIEEKETSQKGTFKKEISKIVKQDEGTNVIKPSGKEKNNEVESGEGGNDDDSVVTQNNDDIEDIDDIDDGSLPSKIPDGKKKLSLVKKKQVDKDNDNDNDDDNSQANDIYSEESSLSSTNLSEMDHNDISTIMSLKSYRSTLQESMQVQMHSSNGEGESITDSKCSTSQYEKVRCINIKTKKSKSSSKINNEENNTDPDNKDDDIPKHIYVIMLLDASSPTDFVINDTEIKYKKILALPVDSSTSCSIVDDSSKEPAVLSPTTSWTRSKSLGRSHMSNPGKKILSLTSNLLHNIHHNTTTTTQPNPKELDHSDHETQPSSSLSSKFLRSRSLGRNIGINGTNNTPPSETTEKNFKKGRGRSKTSKSRRSITQECNETDGDPDPLKKSSTFETTTDDNTDNSNMKQKQQRSLSKGKQLIMNTIQSSFRTTKGMKGSDVTNENEKDLSLKNDPDEKKKSKIKKKREKQDQLNSSSHTKSKRIICV